MWAGILPTYGKHHKLGLITKQCEEKTSNTLPEEQRGTPRRRDGTYLADVELDLITLFRFVCKTAGARLYREGCADRVELTV